MRIQSLEVVGFKSFAERTRLEFTDGVTAIVGPNGCGKSNIVDALMWALGEQSTKRLRGRSMEDLLFNGSESMKQVGLAEVQLTFGVNGDDLPAPYKGYPTITIGRRIYRSGESEYSINNTPCRLKDISDVFLGTGVGSRTYSVIEQGRVSQLVGAKPQDRRAFIEEVAGISRYRSRRLEAERKLEATTQNLQHVDAILVELERQVGSLSRQARKAERYEQHRNEIRRLDADLTGRHALLLKTERAGQAALLEALVLEQAAATAGLSGAETRLEQRRLELVELERSARDRDAEHHAVMMRLTQAEQSLAYVAAERGRIADRRGRLESDRDTLTVLHGELETRIAGASQRHADAQAAHQAAAAHRASIDDSLRVERQGHATVEAELDEQRSQHFGLLNARSMVEGELKTLERREAQLRARVERKDADRNAALRQIEILCEGRAASSTELEHLNRHREALAAERTEVRERAIERRADLENVVRALDTARSRLARSESRCASLEESLRRREGMNEGARRLLAEPRDGESAIRGTVADVVNADDRHARAVEAWLGPALDYLLVDSPRASLPWIALLHRESAGRAGIAPLAAARREPRACSAPPEGEGVVGRLRDQVRVEEPFAALLDELIGEAWLVESLERAVGLWESGVRVPLVSLDGDIVEPSGVVHGGTVAQAASGPIAQRNEIRRLEQEVATLRATLAEHEHERNRLSADLIQLEARFEELGRSLERDESRRMEAVRSLGTAEEAIRQQREVVEAFAFEIEEATRELASIDVERVAHQERLQSTVAAIDQLQEALQAGKARRDEVVRRIEALAAEQLEAARHDASTAQERRASERELAELGERLREAASRIAASVEEQRALDARVEELERSAAEAEEVRSTEGASRERLEAEQQALGRQIDVARSEIAELTHDTRTRRAALEGVHAALQAEQVRRAEIDIRIQSLEQGFQDRYAVSLDAASAVVPPSEVEAERWAQRLDELRKRIHQMGEVNPGAVEEHRQVLERRDFYANQRADLAKSLEELTQAITNINRTTRRRFREAFDMVKESFQQVFPRLFPGGQGDLLLTEGADLLEAGVEIVVRPAGKKLQSIDLLSGGEKAMAALALMFAILKVKPSPFCLLDEVDAPLDEANIGRFNDLVRELAVASQVVVITHSKKTMGVADRLYGVTMPKPGISQVVGVSLN
ncbi:MAG: chromosome segregation protein SMC [bacterium]